ncbi:MAG: DUF87 domain-containing protein [Planctomycetota bacterium]
MHNYELPATFYLGRPIDSEGKAIPEPLLYDAKDLCTHALIVGMTGSGKTGLGVGLLEEAAIDGIPSIVIDPKGDMANLMLQFPELSPKDFEPWVDEGEASRKGKTVAEFAAGTAAMWEKGLADWDQPKARIQKLKDSAEVTVYTPGATTARPLRVLRSFDAPPASIREDAEALGDRVQSCVAGLLALVGIDADPLQSRESILLSNILLDAWNAGRNMDLARLITHVQNPPFERLGVMDVESFFPQKERFKLAMTLNNVLASPGFAAWMEGEPLDVQNLLYTKEGKPRVSILSIAHLSDAERMFFVSILLGEVVAWMRTQPGTSSLRALLYMDEIFGFFPPTAEPPSKKPMMTLLKQARAFGLGCILSTQNPVDLDYKGLSNCGSWFLGRLQTERDKARVLDGLEGAMSEGGNRPSRADLDAMLSGLGKRVFLLNNVHESGPVTFTTRWVLSYLRGPMTKQELTRLCKPPTPAAEPVAKGAEAAAPAPTPAPAPSPVTLPPAGSVAVRPEIPDTVTQAWLPLVDPPARGEHLVYQPQLLVRVDLHYVSSPAKVDQWKNAELRLPLPEKGDRLPIDAIAPQYGTKAPKLATQPHPDGQYGLLTTDAGKKTTWRSWQSSVKDHFYQNEAMVLWKSAEHKLTSEPGESEATFRSRLQQASREMRDLAVEKLRDSYTTKLDRAREKVRKAEQKVETQEDQYSEVRTSTWARVGSVVASLLGRKRSRSDITAAAKAATRARREKADVRRAEDDLDQVEREYRELEKDLERELEDLRREFENRREELEELRIAPRKTDIQFDAFTLIWVPYHQSAEGKSTPAW